MLFQWADGALPAAQPEGRPRGKGWSGLPSSPIHPACSSRHLCSAGGAKTGSCPYEYGLSGSLWGRDGQLPRHVGLCSADRAQEIAGSGWRPQGPEDGWPRRQTPSSGQPRWNVPRRGETGFSRVCCRPSEARRPQRAGTPWPQTPRGPGDQTMLSPCSSQPPRARGRAL